MNSSGAVFAHNVFGGKFTVVKYDGRMTPYHLSHSTEMKALHDNPGGDVQFLNNLFVGNANASEYSNALLPVHFEGNVYTKGTVQVINKNSERKFKKLSENANGKTKNYKEQEATEHNALLDQEFDAMAQLLTENNVVYLEINLDKNWLAQKRTLVTTQRLQPAIVSNLPFENMDGSPIIMNTDYFGNKRNSSNPSPGAFEIGKTGTQKIKVWQDK
jgi:alpha-N-arabinofuranosidase